MASKDMPTSRLRQIAMDHLPDAGEWDPQAGVPKAMAKGEYDTSKTSDKAKPSAARPSVSTAGVTFKLGGGK